VVPRSIPMTFSEVLAMAYRLHKECHRSHGA